MDEKLKNALDNANYMISFNNQRRLLKQTYRDDLLYYVNGGEFTADCNLINFVNLLVSKQQTSYIIVDNNDIPIEITELSSFLDELLSTYSFASNTYFTKYNNLKTKRSVEGIMDD